MIDEEALEKLKHICLRDHKRDLSDEEAQKVGERIIRFICATEDLHQEPQLTEIEKSALDFIRSRENQGKGASVRELAAHLGFSSSRSGQRIVDSLVQTSLAYRDEDGVLRAL